MRTIREKGFTLIEMVVVMALIGILMSIAIPSLLSQRPLWRVNGAARSILTDMRLTQSKAIRSGDPHSIVFYSALQRYQVIEDSGAGGGTAGDGIINGGEVVVKTVDLADNFKDVFFGVTGAVSISGGVVPADGVDFPSRGGAKSVVFRPDSSSDNGAVYLYPQTAPSQAGWQRAVKVVGNSGMVKVFAYDSTSSPPWK